MKWGEAKNGTASNGDNLPAGDFSLAEGVLGRIEKSVVHQRHCSEYPLNTSCSTEVPSVGTREDYVCFGSEPAGEKIARFFEGNDGIFDLCGTRFSSAPFSCSLSVTL
jgi:hypothetical protein